jgi:hypothetical protein
MKPAPQTPTPRPARTSRPGAAPAPTRRYVPPVVNESVPRPQRASVRARAKPNAARNRVLEPAAVRHLPIRDPSIVRVTGAADVLAAVAVVPAGATDDEGLSTMTVVSGVWLGLAGALLLIASLMPYVAVADPLVRLNDRRGQLALIGVNMIAVVVVGYLVAATS